MPKTIIHVLQNAIRKNTKTGSTDRVMTAKKAAGHAQHGHQASIVDEDGQELVRFVYRPQKPLSCGARLWAQTKFRVVMLDLDGNPLRGEQTKPCKTTASRRSCRRSG